MKKLQLYIYYNSFNEQLIVFLLTAVRL